MIRIGACIWNFNAGPYCAPYESAIQAVAKAGFHGAEPIVFNDEDLTNYFSPQKVRELRTLIEDNGMSVTQLDIYDHAIKGLASFEPASKAHAIDNFKRCVEVAQAFGTTVLNTVSQWPADLRAPISYPPSYIYPEMRGVDKISSKWSFDLPQGWSWQRNWDNYVDSIRACLDIAAQAGVTFTVEGHCHVIVSGADSMLLLLEALDHHPNLGFTLDTGWHLRQREYLPTSIYKLGSRLKNLHVRDTDGLLNYGLPVGQGIVDWHHVVRALQDVGYDGHLVVEMSGAENPTRIFTESRRYLEDILDGAQSNPGDGTAVAAQ